MHDTLRVLCSATRSIANIIRTRLTFAPDLRLQREFRAAALARRGRARQGLAAREDAGRSTGSSSPICALLFGYMFGASGQEAALHGRRVRAEPRVESRPQPRSTGICSRRRCRTTACKTLVARSQRLYRDCPALHARDAEREGFEWIDVRRRRQRVIAFACVAAAIRTSPIAVCNFTPVRALTATASAYRTPGRMRELLNTDAGALRRQQRRQPWARPCRRRSASHGREQSIAITLPPLAAVYFSHRCAHETGRPPRSPGRALSAGRDLGRQRRQLRAVLRPMPNGSSSVSSIRAGTREMRRITLPEFTDEVWHGYLPEMRPRHALRLSRLRPLRSRATATVSTTTSC